MAKRSANEWNSELAVAVDTIKVIKSEEPQTVRLRLLQDVKLYITGLSGTEYFFNRGGSELDVDYEDAQIFLKKRIGGCDNCPSNSGSRPYFEIVEA